LGKNWRGSADIVVGVARDFVYGSLIASAEGAVVEASDDNGYGSAPRFVVHQVGTRTVVPEDIRRALAQALPGLPAPEVITGTEIVARDLGTERLGAWFFSGFGLVALLVGTGSVFGMVAYLAESRQRECGVRLALGANRADLLRLGIMTALVPVGFGVAAGVVAAALVSRVFVSLLVGVSRLDALTYVTVSAAMLISAGAAALVAAWRLRHVKPADALRTI
jgi:predicted lysophospholipase L1 biosynthesis ABC-type transport system permease subunit